MSLSRPENMWIDWSRGCCIALVAILSVVLINLWLSQRRLRQLASEIPGPPSLPLLGNLLLFLKGPDKLFTIVREQWLRYQGRSIRFWLGPLLYVIITSAEDVEFLLANQRVLNRDRYMMKMLNSVFGDGLLTSRAERWKKQRKIIAPLFQTKKVERYVKTFNKQTRVLVGQLEKFADGRSFDIFSLLLMCTGDMICESALGYSLDLQGEGGQEKATIMNRMTRLVFERLVRPWLYADFLFNLTARGKEQKKALDVLTSYSDIVLVKTLQEHREIKATADIVGDHWVDEARNFPQHMIRSYERDGKPLDEKDMRDELHTIGLAGMDTTAATVGFIFMMLGLHLQLQEDIYQELKEIFLDDWEREVTPGDVKQMKRLDRFIKETMRIIPVVPVIPREVEEEVKLSNCTLPAGCLAIVMNYFVHRDPRYFPDPERFDPDRFLRERSKERHPYSYLPFGAGPRMCVGFKYAEMSMAATVATVLKRYRFLPAVAYEDVQKLDLGIVFRPSCGFQVKILPREPAN